MRSPELQAALGLDLALWPLKRRWAHFSALSPLATPEHKQRQGREEPPYGEPRARQQERCHQLV